MSHLIYFGLTKFKFRHRSATAMRNILLLLLSLTAISTGAQITINSSHLPNAGDILYRRNATLLSEVDLEATGENYTWNFGEDIIQLGPLDNGTECNDLSDISLFNQLYFNNPFNPQYDSDFGLGFTLVDLGFITVEDAFQVYKNSGNVYAITGVAATVSDLPISSIYDERDIIYNLPLTYPASGSSHSVLELTIPSLGNFATDQTRTYECDGWGVLNIAGQSFDVLRVKSQLVGSDAIFGFEIPKDITTYQWLSTDFNVPVLEITSTAVLGQAQITASTADIGVGVSENSTDSWSVYPVPTENDLMVPTAFVNSTYTIFNSSGQLMKQGTLAHTNLDVSQLPSGVYILQISDDAQTQQARFVRR
jgi:hypothetical protein